MKSLYIAFDADNDIKYYHLMEAWNENLKLPFTFINAHDLREIRDGSCEESIKTGLRERMQQADLFILLVGERTKYLYKYVRWEVELAKTRKLPCIAVNLNGKRGADEELCPRAMLESLAIHINFNMKVIEYAIEHWPQYLVSHSELRGSYHYKSSLYNELEI